MNFQPLYADLEEIAPDDPLLAKFAALCEARGVPPGRFNILVNLTLRRALDEAEGQPLTLASVSRAFAEHASAYGIAPEVQTEIVSTMQTTAQAIGIEGEAPPADAATTETETEETMNTDHAYPIVNPPIEGDEERTARAAHDATRGKRQAVYAMLDDPRYAARTPAGELYRQEVSAKFAEVFGNDSAGTSERGLGV